MAINYNSFAYDKGNDMPEGYEIKNIILHFGIFFDGTCNNLWNTAAQEVFRGYKEHTVTVHHTEMNDEAEKAYKKYKEEESSYENDFTNVARLFQTTIDDEYAIYIEGPGTTSTKNSTDKITYGGDNSSGLGFGQGSSGIRGKVQKACQLLAQKIISQSQCLDRSKYLQKVVLDVYGFSRGAAAARNFIYEVTNAHAVLSIDSNVDTQTYVLSKLMSTPSIPRGGFLGYYLKEKDIDLNYSPAIEIRFAGLFDTVSSYDPKGITGKLGSAATYDFGNDVGQLWLNFLNDTKYVLHLTAADEHREKFSLTTIDTKLAQGDGSAIEIELPGVHSDVGGSYVDAINEEVEVLDIGIVSAKIIGNINLNFYDKENRRKMRMDYDRLIEQGWFRPNQRTTDIGTSRTYELKFKRNNLSNKYNVIPLRLMYNFMEKWQIGEKSPIDPNKFEFVINGSQLKSDYPLFKNEPKNLKKFIPQKIDLFSIKDNIIHFKAGTIECTISEKLYSSTTPFGKGSFWAISGRGLQDRYDTWSECVQYLIRYMFEHIELVVPDSSIGPLLFAAQYYLNELPAQKYVYPAIIRNGVDLRKYRYDTWLERGKKGQELLEQFKKNIPSLNASLNQQIYIRRLRNRFLHWSSKYNKNVENVTSSNYPRIVDDERLIRQRDIIHDNEEAKKK